MFRDTQRELERLEAELLAEEEEETPVEEESDDGGILWDEDEEEAPAEEEPVVYRNYSNHYGQDLRNYANGYRAYNADRTDVDLDEFSEDVEEEPKENNRGLMALACVLLLAIAAVLAWWVFRLLGR